MAAKTLEQLLKDQLGHLVFECSRLSAIVEAQAEEIAKLKADKPEPDAETAG